MKIADKFEGIREAVGKSLGVIPKTNEEIVADICTAISRTYDRMNKYTDDNGASVSERMYNNYGDKYFTQLIIQKSLEIETLAGEVNAIEECYNNIALLAAVALMCTRKNG